MLIEKKSAQNNINKIKLIEKTCTDRNLKREINKVLNSQLSFFLYVVIESIILLLIVMFQLIKHFSLLLYLFYLFL